MLYQLECIQQPMHPPRQHSRNLLTNLGSQALRRLTTHRAKEFKDGSFKFRNIFRDVFFSFLSFLPHIAVSLSLFMISLNARSGHLGRLKKKRPTATFPPLYALNIGIVVYTIAVCGESGCAGGRCDWVCGLSEWVGGWMPVRGHGCACHICNIPALVVLSDIFSMELLRLVGSLKL